MIVATYVVFFLITGLWDFYIFGNWHDLSRFTTAQYSFSQGHFFLSRLHTQSGGQTYELIGDHFAPTKLIILPFFLVFRTAAVFLIFKTIVMGLSAIPLYLVARTRLKPLESLFLAVAYLLIPTAVAQNYTGFHPVVFATLLIPLAIYFFELRRFGWFMAAMLLSNGLKENVPFIMLLYTRVGCCAPRKSSKLMASSMFLSKRLSKISRRTSGFSSLFLIMRACGKLYLKTLLCICASVSSPMMALCWSHASNKLNPMSIPEPPDITIPIELLKTVFDVKLNPFTF